MKVAALIVASLTVALAYNILLVERVNIGSEAFIPNEYEYWAELDEEGYILRVLNVDAREIKKGLFGNPDRWVKTTKARTASTTPAVLGGLYAKNSMMFVSPKPQSNYTYSTTSQEWLRPEENELPAKSPTSTWFRN